MIPHNGVIKHDVVWLFLYCPFFESTEESCAEEAG